MLPTSSSRQVKSVQTAFRIVEFLQDMDGATMNELATQLDLAKSTVHNYLGTLQSLGYAVEHDGTYRLGLRFLTHGMAAKSGLRIRDAVAHVLPEVATRLEQPVWWVVEEHGRGIFVATFAPESGTQVYGRVGKRSYLHTHAPGKAILARLPEEHVEEIIEYHGLPTYTNETITDPEPLREELATIREQGYAISDGEAALGVRSIGVAFDGPHEYTHGLGVFGYSHDISSVLEQDIPAVLHDAADDISATATRDGVRA